jgi:hypothetical protein
MKFGKDFLQQHLEDKRDIHTALVELINKINNPVHSFRVLGFNFETTKDGERVNIEVEFFTEAQQQHTYVYPADLIIV